MSLSEIITDGGRRCHWSASEKLRIVEETFDGRESISIVARRNGVAPNLLYRWRRLMLEGGSVAVAGDDDVTSNREVREMESRIRELDRQLGRKTPEVEILKEALDRSPKKSDLAHALAAAGKFPVSLVASTLGVARSTVYERVTGSITTRGRYTKADDVQLLPFIQQIAAKRPTYGYRRIPAVLNRQRRAQGAYPVNHMA